jgi:hypothetical protein
MAQQLAEMLGIDEGTAGMYLEMSGGDVDSAMSLYFSMMEGGADESPAAAAAAGPGFERPEIYSMVWQDANREPPAAWMLQGLAFDAKGGLGLPQWENGPCGVLAVFQASVIARLHRTASADADADAAAFFQQGAAYTPSRPLIAATVADILLQCVDKTAPGGAAAAAAVVRLPRFTGAVGQAIAVVEVAGATHETVAAALLAAGDGGGNGCLLDAFLSPGGAILLVYAALLTRGEAAVRRDMSAETGVIEGPLIVGPNSTCSMELTSLLLCGVAKPNVFAYHSATRALQDWPHTAPGEDGGLGVGMISHTEIQAKQPLADGLKSPRYPVWVLHSGDHFTVLFRAEPVTGAAAAGAAAAAASADGGDGSGGGGFESPLSAATSAPVQLFHYNGLPPAGPRMSPLLLEAPRGAAKRAPKAIVDSFVKPVVGEVDDVRFTHAYTQPPNEIIRPILTRRSLVVYPLRSIAQQVVMAHPDDKAARPKEWSTWRFEVVLAVDDPTVTGADPPPDAPPPVTFDHNDWAPPAGAPWRCRHCYANRFQTMCFGQNDTTTPSSSGDGTTDLALTYCQHCGKSMEEAGWSIWLNFDQLPGGFQATLTNRHGPKMLALLRTKWPRAALTHTDTDVSPDLPSV